MERVDKIETVKDAYAFLGHCATGFSALEFNTQFLLSMLAVGKPLSVEHVILTQRHTFSSRIKAIRQLAEVRKVQIPDLSEKAIELATELDKIRARRNLFVHGFWLINEFVLMEGVVRCSDTSWNYDKSAQSFSSMSTEDIPLSELEELPLTIGKLIQRINILNQELQARVAQQTL